MDVLFIFTITSCTYLARRFALIGLRALADCGGGRGWRLGEEDELLLLADADAFRWIASRRAEALVCAWATWEKR